MRWKKKGVIFRPDGDPEWMTSHAAAPVACPIGGHDIRVYYTSRDSNQRGQIGFFDCDAGREFSLLRVTKSPVVGLGPPGAHDESGVTASCLIRNNGKLYLYYTAWSLGVTIPFYLNIGLAISEDGGATFSKASPAPVLGRNPNDPYLTASPFVLIENGIWRMWYISAARWEVINGHPRHYYNVRYAESPDGMDWKSTGITCIDFNSPDEYAFGRPCVIKEAGIYKMWYCSRGTAYRAGYAESLDGLLWKRMDNEAGIDPSDTGWDSEMIAYPWVFDHDGRRYMLYNGNGYGKTGIGLAVLDPG